LLTLTSRQHTPPKTNHNAHLCPLLCWHLQVNRRRVVTPNLVILEKRNQSTILLLADALPFQMAAFFYTTAMQTEKLRLVDEHAKLKTKQPSQPRWHPQATSPTCVSQVTWGPVSKIPDQSHKESHKGSHKEGSHKESAWIRSAAI
jgi:hypothetical protein